MKECSIADCPDDVYARGWCIHHYESWMNHGDPLKAPRRIRGDDERRVWSQVDKNGPVPPHAPELGPCWVWTGTVDRNGYARVHFKGKKQLVHRIVWFLHYGRWPQPCALHRCDNPRCCRWSHLFEGTRAQNVDDMLRKGRGRKATGEEHPNVKLTAEDVREIRREYAASHALKPLAQKYGVSTTSIQAVVTRRTWRHV